MKKNNNFGFTLIELLAVIIILGILMLVAIPSVTTYINESRKSTYVDTALSLVSSVRNKINRGDLNAYDTTTTYYVPLELIDVENTKVSPYGEFKEAYVVLTYDNSGYDYYWTSTDTSSMGITLTPINKLDKNSVQTNVKTIPNNIAICGKNNIVVFGEDGEVAERLIASNCYSDADGNVIETGINTLCFIDSFDNKSYFQYDANMTWGEFISSSYSQGKFGYLVRDPNYVTTIDHTTNVCHNTLRVVGQSTEISKNSRIISSSTGCYYQYNDVC
jgi:prepilin-type N-terminal cleavage/methylation domain-containing protein